LFTVELLAFEQALELRMVAFQELGLDSGILQAIEEEGWLLPTPVQDETIPMILGGGDVMVAAETGSGKTGGR
jgi:ATP-dependent RNA helicase DDX1